MMQAQCGQNEYYFNGWMDESLVVSPLSGGGVCLVVDNSATPAFCGNPDASGNTTDDSNVPYNGVLWASNNLGGCAYAGYKEPFPGPLTDATPLLLLLLGIYGIYTYRKRRGTQIELIEK